MKVEYFNCYTHFVFTTLDRQPIVKEESREQIEKYITGIINNLDSQLYAIFANPEHMHFILSRSPNLSDEELATIVADSSQQFINNNKLTKSYFEWQQTCSAFSVSKGEVDKVCKYILNQAEHHRKITFQEELKLFLKFYQKPLRFEARRR